jgi:hypothetical protein
MIWRGFYLESISIALLLSASSRSIACGVELLRGTDKKTQSVAPQQNLLGDLGVFLEKATQSRRRTPEIKRLLSRCKVQQSTFSPSLADKFDSALLLSVNSENF